MNYAVRITRPFSAVSALIGSWALYCDKLLCYEHEGDVTEKVHIHLLLVGVRVTKDTLKIAGKSMNFKGNGDWSFKTVDKKYGPVTDSPNYITYMSKGIHDPKYNKGYTEAELCEAKANWLDRPVAISKQRRMYLDFEASMMSHNIPKHKVLVDDKWTYPGFLQLRQAALSYAISKNHVISIGNLQTAKMLAYTYAYDNDIDFDQNYLWK